MCRAVPESRAAGPEGQGHPCFPPEVWFLRVWGWGSKSRGPGQGQGDATSRRQPWVLSRSPRELRGC